MGYAEFEEKEFEKPLYNQLEDGECDVWAPGQCFEAHIGFDYSGNIKSSEFWNRFGGYVPKGVVLNDYKMSYVLKKMSKAKMLPNFSLNLFIQAKRPYIHSGQHKSSVYDIKHYSFEINQRQHKILEKLSNKLGHRALLVYASPVFGTYEELYKHTQEKTMISNTSFPKVSDLSGHEHWFYCNADEGIAHSEPEEMDVLSIFEEIQEYREKHSSSYNEEIGYKKNLLYISKTIRDVLHENFKDDVQVNFFFSKLYEIERDCELQYRFIDIDYDTICAFMTITLFCAIFNIDWFTV